MPRPMPENLKVIRTSERGAECGRLAKGNTQARVSFMRQEFIRVFDSPNVVSRAKEERKRLDDNRNMGDFARHVNVTVRVIVYDHFSDGSVEEKIVNWPVENIPLGEK